MFRASPKSTHSAALLEPAAVGLSKEQRRNVSLIETAAIERWAVKSYPTFDLVEQLKRGFDRPCSTVGGAAAKR